MSSNAPMVVSDSPTDKQKHRPQSSHYTTSSMTYVLANEAPFQYSITPMSSVSSIPYIQAPAIPQMHSWNSSYPPGYVSSASGPFVRGHPSIPLPISTYPSYNPQMWSEYYPYSHQTVINTDLAINGSYSAPCSPMSVGFPDMVTRSVVQVTVPGSRLIKGCQDVSYSASIEPRTDKPRDFSRLPRGPPRKPKQSGHAIWVGSLPIDTSVIALKDHFAEGFANEIESVFVILKSNCAFINYATESVSREAVRKFHSSRFMGAILSCRIQKPPADEFHEDVEFPALEKKTSSIISGDTLSASSPISSTDSDSFSKAPTKCGDEQKTMVEETKEEEKYFIIKSLSMEDLVLSVRFGTWTTQSHNEEALNKAYNVCILTNISECRSNSQ
jgi:hypothetical protein